MSELSYEFANPDGDFQNGWPAAPAFGVALQLMSCIIGGLMVLPTYTFQEEDPFGSENLVKLMNLRNYSQQSITVVSSPDESDAFVAFQAIVVDGVIYFDASTPTPPDYFYIFRSSDNGQTWDHNGEWPPPHTLGSWTTLFRFDVSPTTGRIIASFVHSHGTVISEWLLYTDDFGANWVPVYENTLSGTAYQFANFIMRVKPTDPTIVVQAARKRTYPSTTLAFAVLRSMDSGENYSEVDIAADAGSAGLVIFWLNNGDCLYLIRRTSGSFAVEAYISSDDGATWSSAGWSLSPTSPGVGFEHQDDNATRCITTSGDIYIAGYNNTLPENIMLHISPDGLSAEWMDAPVPDSFISWTAYPLGNDLYAVAENKELYVWRDIPNSSDGWVHVATVDTPNFVNSFTIIPV